MCIYFRLRPDFTSKLVHVLAFGTPKFYIAPYDKIKHELVNLSSNCDVKSGLSADSIVCVVMSIFKQHKQLIMGLIDFVLSHPQKGLVCSISVNVVVAWNWRGLKHENR